ncbi:PREDICTED: uncharacterized protein LOC105361083 [Ceratosolen solmsi marchali]|uniref:Uncharacterized protein LOC105361083 n=1 Tax=Ceratosolen solmsi marchali TaxID=326594 RepID=A0AAJ6YEB5_9HYME|nr:PREDICTED: uncharacterized protein LOC105361083 [Ceratosolen solmsi marchali]
MHLKKRYKYYCKKHDTTYLVQSARERVKSASKENRNKFIQSFRTLNVSTNSDVSINENSVRIANNDRNSSKRKDILTNNQLEFSANADVVLKGNPLVTQKSLPTLTDSQTNLIRNSAVFDENKDEDSDFGDDYEEASFRNRKIIKCLIVKKNSESNIIFSKDEDFSESDFDDETSDCDCDCYYHENFKNNFHNYEYESSSDDDMKSLSDTLLNESSFRENKKSKLTL